MLYTFFSRWVYPKQIVSDNGSQFQSVEFKDFVASIGAVQKFTAPYSPSTNGQAERTVGLVKQGLRKVMADSPTKDLAKNIQKFLFSYRYTPQTTTGFSPGELFLGRRLRSRLDLMSEGVQPKSQQPSNFPAPDFEIGSKVRFRMYNGEKRWKLGVVTKVEGPRHYQIEDQGGNVHRRHRNQIVLSRS
jgi:hypothetical protein